MGGIGILLGQQVVEAVLGIIWQPIRKLETNTAEAWGADRDQQGGNGFSSLLQIVETCFDQICTRQGYRHRASLL
jgi:hypothetical protein